MKNRNSTSPILKVVILSLVVLPSIVSAQRLSLPPDGQAPAAAATTASGKKSISSATPSGPITSPAASIPAPTPAASSTISLPPNTAAYVVVKGDSLTRIAEKFNTTRKKLEALNNLTASKVTPGQTLLVPSTKKSKAHHEYAVAQPVQDFDIPASTFASCPVPVPTDDDTTRPPPASVKPAPIAKLVSPSELSAEIARQNAAVAAAKRTPASASPGVSAPMPPSKLGFAFDDSAAAKDSVGSNPVPSSHTSSAVVASSKQGNHGPTLSLNQHSEATTAASDWGSRFLQAARTLGNQGIEYDDDWRPPGESRPWTMDCSNTTRYLYKVTAGIQLPRTASDQYYYLHLQGKAWDVPQTAMGYPDTTYLREHLKPGDLLFWENTYRPDRQPPITHVMVFLGTNDKGQWIMAGSQSSSGGEHNRRNGGPDVYVFRPSQPCGGYSTWLGLVHHRGRFCAFGRPLEADPSKLSVAANN